MQTIITEDLNGICVGNKSIQYEAICEAVDTLPSDIVYLGGSIIEGILDPVARGMGNNYSDIDVFIIRDTVAFSSTLSTYETKYKKTFFCDDFPIGLDVEVYDKGYIEQLFQVITSAELNKDGRIANLFKTKLSSDTTFETINTFLTRLKTSICIYNHEQYKSLKERAPFDKFLELMITYRIVGVDNLIEDIEGNLESEQLDVSLECLRRAFVKVIEISLMKNGYFSDREKWVFLKLKNLSYLNSNLVPLFELSQNVYRGNLMNDTDCKKLIQKGLFFMNSTIENILLGGIEL